MDKGQIQRWTSVAILCFINLINYMDRYTVSGVLTDIEKQEDDWNLNDSKKGLIQTAFVICYFASAPAFGFLGDRYSRKWLMAVGILAWGSCTLASSFMKEFNSFLLLRAAIGFGEAGFTSIAPTVLGDLFNDSKRSIVLALFYFAIPVGSGLGYITGSQVASLANDWRWGLRVTPMLNLVAVVLLLAFLLDPPRGQEEDSKSDSNKKTIAQEIRVWGEDLVYLLTNKSYMLSTLAFTCLTFCTGALSWFGPYFIEKGLLVREQNQLDGYENDFSPDSVGFLFGVVLCVAGVCGLLLGSGLSIWLRKKIAWVDPVICGIGLLVSSPLIFVALYVTDKSVKMAFIAMFFGQVFLNMNWAVVVDISLYVVIPSRRSSAEAFQLMASHALGEAGSPYLTGLISDAFQDKLGNSSFSHYNSSILMSEDETKFTAMEQAMYFSIGFEILGAVLFLLTALYVVSDRRKAEDAEKLEAKSYAT